MLISFAAQKSNIQQYENNPKPPLSCPVCRGIIKPGYDTQIGKVFVCENYPKNCKYIVRKER